MRYDISGLDKAKLLVALYDNAKNSKWTKATIGNIMCPDSFVCDMMSSVYQPKIEAKIKKLELTEEMAEKLLASSSQVDYVGPVLININFSGDEIDTTSYDKYNHGKGGAELAGDVVSELRAESSASCRM